MADQPTTPDLHDFLSDTYRDLAEVPRSEPLPPVAAAAITLALGISEIFSAEGSPLHEWLHRAVRDGVAEAIEDAVDEGNLPAPRE